MPATFPAPAAAGPAADAMPTADDVRAAARRLRGVVRRTPLERSDGLSRLAGADVHLKLETLQRTGSFKLRGAYNRLATLAADDRARGVVTASAGNHGLGVALAARLLGLAAVVYVPADAPEVKRLRIARLGAELRPVPGGYDDAHAAAEAHAAETGACFVHPYSDAQTVAGQGTVGLEVFADLPAVRTLLVPVGGGGLVNGIGLAARTLGAGVRLVGVQSEATAAMHASLAAGRLVRPPMPTTLCEGLSGETDERSLALARRLVDEVVLVSEAAVRRAIRWLYREEGIVAEGSAAVAAAALLEGAVTGLEGQVAAVLTGSNLDPARLAVIVAEG
ncbi:MAG TPA: pyridoxal-phosphate dependent enzyme [Longimicrobiaceae bacterium]|nr:pyridoxal-phosphate dependent enzyme [Longimicrobiaceae bacterium]